MVARTPEAVEQRIVAAWHDGHKVLRIATRAGVSEWTVRRVLADHGIAVPRTYPRRTTPEQDADMVRRYTAGESSTLLAHEFGLRKGRAVLERVRAAGQPVRPRGGRPLS